MPSFHRYIGIGLSTMGVNMNRLPGKIGGAIVVLENVVILWLHPIIRQY